MAEPRARKHFRRSVPMRNNRFGQMVVVAVALATGFSISTVAAARSVAAAGSPTGANLELTHRQAPTRPPSQSYSSGSLASPAAVPTLVRTESGGCTVLTSGGVHCWGYGADGELGNGTFYTTGNRGSASPVTVVAVGGSGALTGVTALAPEASEDLGFCALLRSGGVDCWGYGAQGQLGDGGFQRSATPVAVVGAGGSGTLSGVSALASDGTGYCALLGSGGVDCWGDGFEGQLGDGNFYQSGNGGSATPVAVVGVGGSGTLSGVSALASDGSGYCARLSSGGVDCWGVGEGGNLGNGIFYSSSAYGSATPVSVIDVSGSGTLTGVAAVTPDHSGYCAVLSSGGVDCWGGGSNGQLGDGILQDSATPVAVIDVSGSGTLSGVNALDSDADGYCALLSSGSVDCWGYGYYGELGDGSFQSQVATPAAVVDVTGSGTLSGVSALTSDGGGYCALLTSGNVDCWGEGVDGQLGDGNFYLSPQGSATPVSVIDVTGSGTLSGVSALASEAPQPDVGYGYCVLASGKVDCWGDGQDGQLGDGAFSGNPYPVVVGSAPPAISWTVGGGTPNHKTNCNACPINSATGEFHQSFIDLAIPGRGLSIDLTRTYSSLLAAKNSPFGYGWANSYDMFLSIDPGSGAVTVHNANGSSVTYASDGGGTFNGPSSDFATLTQDSTTHDYTYTRTTGESYLFNSTGQLIKEIDRNGYVTTLTYSGSNLATVADPAGRTLNFAYGTNGDVSSVTDAGGRKVTYTYDSSGNLDSITNAAGGVTSFTYDSSHRMLTETDPRGGKTTLTYNSSGEVASWTDAMSRTTTYTYSGPIGGTETTTETDARGDVTDWSYKALELTSKTMGAGTSSAATTSYTYDPVTLGLTSVTDPNGHVTNDSYDSGGNLLSSTDPLGHTISHTYNAFDEVLTTTDPKGVTTTNTYDSHGNLLSTSTPVGGQTATTSYTYSTTNPGDVVSMTNPNGKTSTYAYDKYGDRTTSTDPLGDATNDTYNVLGQKTEEKSPLGRKTKYTNDPLGDVLTVTDPLGHVTTNTYDSNQNLTTTTDANGNVTTKTYNADNELTSTVVKNSSNVTTSSQSTTYDQAGNIASQVNGVGQATTYAYDALNRQTSSTDANGRVTTDSYDAAGNRVGVTDPEDRTTSTAYNADNEAISVTYSDGVTPNVTYAYDADGQRTSMTDGTGTTTYTYDALHRLTGDTQGGGQSVAYAYDLAGNLITLTYPGGKVVTRTYDAANRLTGVTDWLSHATTFVYDNDGNLITQKDPNGVTSTTKYDKDDRPTKLTDRGAKTLLSLSDSRDALGQVTKESAKGTTVTFGYDASDRLTSSNVGPSPLDYNQASELTQAGTTAYSYDPASELTSTNSGSGSTTYGYDSLGERTSATPPTGPVSGYSYDQAGVLTGFTQGTTAATYAFNGDGLRMSKSVNGTASSFVWDMADGLPLVLSDGTSSYVTGPGGFTFEQVNGSTISYLFHDQLGSTRLITDGSGNNIATYTYNPFGTIATHTGTATTTFGFAGQYTDPETGLQYLRARFYDPATGDFMSVDPLQEITSNDYLYAANNPINAIDPSGKWCFPPWDGSQCDNPGTEAVQAVQTGHVCTIFDSGCSSALDNLTNNTQIVQASPFGKALLTVDPFLKTGLDVNSYWHGDACVSKTTLFLDVIGDFGASIPGGQAALPAGLNGAANAFWHIPGLQGAALKVLDASSWLQKSGLPLVGYGASAVGAATSPSPCSCGS